MAVLEGKTMNVVKYSASSFYTYLIVLSNCQSGIYTCAHDFVFAISLFISSIL